MNKDFIIHISIEKFAAFLDGNLVDSEMAEVQNLISGSDALQEISAIDSVISESMLSFTDSQLYQLPDISCEFEIPEIPTIGLMEEIGSMDNPLDSSNFIGVDFNKSDIDSIIDDNSSDDFSEGLNFDE